MVPKPLLAVFCNVDICLFASITMTQCCCLSVAKFCWTLCDPMDCIMPGFPVFQLSPRVCSNSCPLSQWFFPTISSSVVPLSSCPQSFPASGAFPRSGLFTSGATVWHSTGGHSYRRGKMSFPAFPNQWPTPISIMNYNYTCLCTACRVRMIFTPVDGSSKTNKQKKWHMQ